MTKIKSIKTIQTEIDGTSFLSEYLEYNDDNELTLSIKYDADGNVIEKIENIYEDGKKVTEKNHISEDELAEEHHFEYDTDGKLKTERIHYAEGYSAIRNVIRDKNKGELRIEEVDENGEIEEYTVQQYDENDKMTEKAEYDHRGKLVSAVRLTYNDKGQVVVQEEYEKKMKKPVRIREYSYTENGDIESMIVKNHKRKVIDRFVLEYDDKGHLLKQQSAQAGIISREYEGDLLKKETHTNAAGNIIAQTEYDYDEHGNVIKESNDMVKKTYEIQYFD
ncbi:MAG: hypothetical protein U9Q98_03940 [Bacteroidota bacterium]|nr:hypothetical protein [Bacteroidota bacterium]